MKDTMWKDLFYFTRADRRVLAVSALIILSTTVLRSDMLHRRPEMFCEADSLAGIVAVVKTDTIAADTTVEASAFIVEASALEIADEPVMKEWPAQKYERYKFEKGTVVDLNSTDTTELKRVPGIGSYYAKRIVDYRERLGGYVNVDQLLEINRLPDTLRVWFCVRDSIVRKIKLNSASFSQLLSHPYLNYEQVKVIVNRREKKGELKNPAQLSLYEEFTERDMERLMPYLGFD